MSTVPESVPNPRLQPPVDLTRFAWLSIAAALVTIGLKGGAWLMTGSVGLLSDAAESLVNLVAAIVALFALRVSIRPPDKNHNYGHSKAEYFSAVIEGVMIFVAAAVIIFTAIDRLLHPRELENVGIGLLISVLASIVNGLVSRVLLVQGKRHRSPTLTADAHHLLTDVWTSVGVVAGVGLVAVTGLPWLDPVVAMAVGVNILFTGWRLIARSTEGLMDISLPKDENARIRHTLDRFTSDTVKVHAMRTRESGHRRFMEYHLLVPGAWTVQQAHDFAEDITDTLMADFPDLRVTSHLEPVEDPRSYDDIEI